MGDGLLTTPVVLDRMARALPDHLALITEDRAFTFAQLRAEVRHAAAAMMAAGVQSGDRVALWSPNTWYWVVSCLAAHHAGAVVVPINTAYTAEEAGDILARSRAVLLIAANAFLGADKVTELDAAALPSLRRVVRVPDGWGDFVTGDVASPAQVDARAAAVRPDDVADILFTSGTTGRGKGVVCAHRQSLSAAAAAAECRLMSSADRYLCMAPFSHSYGYKDGVLGCLQSGATLITQRTFDPEMILRVIAERCVTILPGPPTLFRILLDHPAREHFDTSSLRLASTGGAPVAVALVERIRRDLGVETVRTGYGLTEASGFGTATRHGDDPVTVASTCGRPIAGFELRIDAPDAEGVGEVLLRGPNVMLGYLDDPAATAAVIDAEGWLHTGDIGSVDANGNLRITDRLTDMYICGGVNVYPAEVEGVLVRIDGVADVGVIGVPDGTLGEVGRAFVVARPGTALTEADVISHARRHLAPFKVPRSVVLLGELPRNAGGKVLKTALRQMEYIPPPEPVRAVPEGRGGPPVGRIENWVADTWQDLLVISRPGRRDRFTDLGGDSVTAAEFAHRLHTQFGVSMSLDSLADRPTIAAVVAGLERGENRQRQPVVGLRDGDTGPVCLMVPGIGGHAWKFLSLARALTAPGEVLALSLMDLYGDGDGSIRARACSAARSALEPHAAAGRPVMLAGYSFGAMIAADLACRLSSEGMSVAKLILLDPDPLDSTETNWDPSITNLNMSRLVFMPGSPAARKLDAEITEISAVLQDAYLDGSIRLPQTPIAWLQTRAMAEKYRAAPAIFGTPVTQIERTVVELGHLAMMDIPGVYQVAQWLDRQLV